MPHASFLLNAPPPARHAPVLVPLPVGCAFDYAFAEGIDAPPGSFVRVPVGRREVVGVAWDGAPDGTVDPAKIKAAVEVLPLPPLPEAQRRFIERVAAYTLSDLGSVLKLVLSAPDVFTPQKRKSKETESPPPRPAVPPVLSAAQDKAAAALREAVEARAFSTTLLDGVTGSGKTEVYFEAVRAALETGGQALVLLPEIALSAPFVARFEKRFGFAPVLWHSHVTPAKRREAWRAVALGEARVVAGARSALFLPFPDLRLIVVDEEHDASYKQEEGVLYHARDMAVLRARLGGAPCVLASATPSLETAENARSGKYARLVLPERHAGAKMPQVRIIDLKIDKPARQRFISPTLGAALAENFAAGKQSLLFLNRRGYAPLTLCRACGHRFRCPSCSAWLVEHKKSSCLQCHHCGHAQKMPKACPTCAAEGQLAACGPGVERIAEEARELLPDARTLILASDMEGGGKALDAALCAIERREADVIVGTQIVAKGHHFPHLTVVGVIDADLGLAGGDPRAGERTFQLMQQVGGRAGRGEDPGRVFLQTYMPEQAVIRALAANNRDAFLDAEAAGRREAGMPPFGRLAALVLASEDAAALETACRLLAKTAPRYDDVRVLGPAEAPLALLRGKHRRRFLIKAERGVAIQEFLKAWLDPVKLPASVRIKVDVDPQSFL
jgi:primosomal protein N' (replication factor Y) (superfamily II helicase)